MDLPKLPIVPNHWTSSEPDEATFRNMPMNPASKLTLQAQVFFLKGDYARAIQCHTEAFRMRAYVLGEDSIPTAMSSNALGEVRIKWGTKLLSESQQAGDESDLKAREILKQAEEDLKKTMRIREKPNLSGDKGLIYDAALTRDSLGRLYETLGRLDEARDVRKRVVDVDGKGNNTKLNGKDVCCGSPECESWTHDLSKLKTCGACKAIFYCTATCQKKDWPRHKIPCKAFSEADSNSN